MDMSLVEACAVVVPLAALDGGAVRTSPGRPYFSYAHLPASLAGIVLTGHGFSSWCTRGGVCGGVSGACTPGTTAGAPWLLACRMPGRSCFVVRYVCAVSDCRGECTAGSLG